MWLSLKISELKTLQAFTVLATFFSTQLTNCCQLFCANICICKVSFGLVYFSNMFAWLKAQPYWLPSREDNVATQWSVQLIVISTWEAFNGIDENHKNLYFLKCHCCDLIRAPMSSDVDMRSDSTDIEENRHNFLFDCQIKIAWK